MPTRLVNVQRIFAIDPGEEHCGWAMFIVGEKDLHVFPDESLFGGCVSTGEWKPDTLMREMHKLEADVVVCEEFRLYPNKAAVQSFSQLKTVEVIGVLRYLCESVGMPFVEQGAAIKKVARAQMLARGIYNRAVTERKGGHAADAVLHGWFFLNKPKEQE